MAQTIEAFVGKALDEAKISPLHIKIIGLIAAGYFFDVIDFTVFGFFAAMIGDQFFPSTDPMTSLLLAVSTFGVGFFMRPLGAVLIGAYADRVG